MNWEYIVPDGYPKFEGVSLGGVLKAIQDKIEEIWLKVDLDIFTDHGPTHSERVIKNIGRIISLNFQNGRTVGVGGEPNQAQKLSDLELFVLAASALVHDIGMQARRFYPNLEQEAETTLRSKHWEYGYKMLQDSEVGTPPVELPTNILSDMPNRLRSAVMQVCNAHTGDGWDNVMGDYIHREWQNQTEGDELFRIPLMAGVFRIADELDCTSKRLRDYRLLKNLNRVTEAKLPFKSRQHWLACYYIRGLSDLENGQIKLYCCTPPESDQQDGVAILREFRIQKIQEELGLVRPYLLQGKISLNLAYPDRLEVDNEILKIPQDFLKQLLPGTASRQGNQKKSSSSNAGSKAPHEEQAEFVDCGPYANQLLDALSILRAHIETGKWIHIKLTSGYHTGFFLDCRPLLSDVRKRQIIAEAIYSCYKERNIKAVLAPDIIDASLAALVGQRLQIPVIESPERLDWREGDSLLVVCCILASGSYLLRLIQRIPEGRCNPFKVEAIPLYHLGNLALPSYSLPVSIMPLVNKSDVPYWPEDVNGRCRLCRFESS